MHHKLVHPAVTILLVASMALAASCGAATAPPTPQSPSAAPQQTLMPAYTACSPGDPDCALPAVRTPEALDPAVLSILGRDEFVRSIVGSSELWKDYWLNPSGNFAVDIVFARPVSFSGTVPSRSHPCNGHGNEGDVDPADPCLQVTPVYGTTQLEFQGQRWIQVFVDVERGRVVEVFAPGVLDQSVDRMIEYLTKYRPAIATPTPSE